MTERAPWCGRTASAVGVGAHAGPAVRRQIENLIIVLFWVLVLEGALRKWVWPQYARYLFFVRDPFVLVIYFHALRAGVLRAPSGFLVAGVAFAALAIPLAMAQSVSLGGLQSLLVIVYGWRQYFLYLPLPFIMARVFDGESVDRFARHAIIALVINAPIVMAQFRGSPDSILNRGIGEEESLQFRSMSLVVGRIRPGGTFTSTVGIKELVASGCALILAAWLSPARQRPRDARLLGVGTAALATCLAFSGSRGAFMHCALILASGIAVGAVSRQTSVRNRAFAWPLLLAGAGTVLYPLLFPDALSAIQERFASAHVSESRYWSSGIIGRALYDPLDFLRYLGSAPLLGHGLGLGGNGRMFLANTDPEFVARIYSESEWSRHIVDLGPVLGVCFILYRIAFALWLFSHAFRAVRRGGSPLPLLLFGYVGVMLFNGQVTGHGTVGGFAWIYLGIALAVSGGAAMSRSSRGQPGALRAFAPANLMR